MVVRKAVTSGASVVMTMQSDATRFSSTAVLNVVAGVLLRSGGGRRREWRV